MKRAAAIAALAATCAACGSGSTASRTYAAHVNNPWFPLRPGTVWIYRGVRDGKPSRDVVRVLSTTRVIDGVRCTSVSDKLYLAGKLAERTTDWYAQDSDGTVWYFGEATAELDRRGRVTSTEGSWRSGVGGARAGVFMPARPRVGQSFRQEFFKGHAEDHFRVIQIGDRRLVTMEWTPLEPDVIDHKTYVRRTGLVKEETVKGGDERATLISVRGG